MRSAVCHVHAALFQWHLYKGIDFDYAMITQHTHLYKGIFSGSFIGALNYSGSFVRKFLFLVLFHDKKSTSEYIEI